jgi:Zn-dependent protease
MGSFSFRLGSIPVRIQGLFLLTAVLLGLTANAGPISVPLLAIVVVASTLVHELGHALVGMAYGLRPQIDLHGMGGTTSWLVDPSAAQDVRERLSPFRSVVVSLAGPCFGLLLAGLAYAVDHGFRTKPALLHNVLEHAVVWNVVWSVFNLLPILPLDGGNVLASTVRGLTSLGSAPKPGEPVHTAARNRGQIGVRYWSIGLAVVLGLLALRGGALVLAVISALFVMQNVRGIALLRRLEGEAPLHDAVAKGKDAVNARDGRLAISYGEAIVRDAVTMEMRREGLMLLAYGRLLEGHWAQLMQLLGDAKVEFGAGELARFETAVRDLGRPEDAEQIRHWAYQTAGFKP